MMLATMHIDTHPWEAAHLKQGYTSHDASAQAHAILPGGTQNIPSSYVAIEISWHIRHHPRTHPIDENVFRILKD